MDYQEQLKRMGKYEEPKPIKKKEPPKEIDWEQRRYEIAKEIFCNHYEQFCDSKKLAKMAVCDTDLLIEELKKTSR